MQVLEYESWVGATRCVDDVVGLNSARQMSALLDLAPQQLGTGQTVPAHWYAMLFAPTAPQSSLDRDGHPHKGDFLPPIALPRRMFAGRRATFHRPLCIGDSVTRSSRISRITPKTGRSGEMVFVTVEHAITGAAGLLVSEEQDIVYRAAASAAPAAPATQEPVGSADFSAAFTPGVTDLFRYSAITFNAHRIHYDADYAQATEGYPGLVVNGGLTTLRLWQLVAERTRRPIVRSASRNLQPLFVDRPVTLCGRLAPGSDQVLAWAQNADGQVAVRMELELGAA